MFLVIGFFKAIAMGVATAVLSVTGAAFELPQFLGPVAIALSVVAATVGVWGIAYKGISKKQQRTALLL
ncbi:hypothetical protein CW304_16840 [Bacillus sp. UFRGS-B20]|nr:hypothetical protein CW304_16840 [Bacillus sp. UFRGS-B20]